MAVGKSGERVQQETLEVSIGGVPITGGGQRLKDYDESQVTSHLAGQEVHILVQMGIGEGRARVWTCDLTHGYIEINADYRS